MILKVVVVHTDSLKEKVRGAGDGEGVVIGARLEEKLLMGSTVAI